jgi:predicted dienelactone hydrolase
MRRRAARIGAVVLLVAGSTAVAGAATAPRVQLRSLRLVDTSRRARYRDGTSGARVLVTQVRWPASGRGPFPLVVFAHGFALMPGAYARLLDTWARAGYVVAAPAFPVEGARAPGGPDRSDLGNEPGDLHFVISRLTAPTSPLHALIDPGRIAVAGHSDGAVAALSAAYDRRFRDRRIDAAIVMSGATLPGFTQPARGSPPLLAVQGTSDTLNPPATTSFYFRRMRRPKFLLWLLGAPHREPFTTDDRWFGVVGRATTAFLAHALQGAPLRPLIAAGSDAGVARIDAEP